MNNKQNKANALWRMCMVALIWMLTTTLYAQNVTVSGIVKDHGRACYRCFGNGERR